MYMKVDEKLYEIEVVEEEWRSDSDWWLSEEDRQSSMATLSETSSIVQQVIACNNHANFDLPREVGEVNGHDLGEESGEENGLVGSDVPNGLEESSGFIEGQTNEVIKDKEEGSMGDDLEDSSTTQKEKSRDGTGKRRRKIADCYLKELIEIWKERVDWVTARIKQRKIKRRLNLDYLSWRNGMRGRGNIREVWVGVGNAVVGASGGLLCVWDRMNFSKLGQFTEDGYLGIKGLWGVKKEVCCLVSVYAPNDRKKKAELWDELSIEERRGRIGESPDIKEFNDFIEVVGLVDHKLANRRFTWYRPDGTSMSRLDKVLMTSEMTKLGGEWVQQGLKRTISDHCAIVMKTKTTHWGPKPFRVLDVWQQHPEFKTVVEEKWNEMAVDGFAGYRVAAKVERVDMKNEEFTLEEDEVHERQEGFQEIWDIMRKREALWKQKSRRLSCDGQWLEELELVKKATVDYFQKLFCGESWNRPKPSGIIFKQINEEMRVCLKQDFVSFFREFHQHGRFGFGLRWRGWIKDCLSIARISMLVNGSAAEEFMMGKGLRQGDPLSPFLFLMIAEGLHGIVKKAETEGLIHGIDVGSKGLTTSLLQFADDTVILGKANGENIFTVQTILRWFELMSGLRINFRKSSIVEFNVAQRWLNGATTVLRGVGELPFVHLGMPVDGNPRTKKLWDLVLNKFRTKLAIWKSALLSFGSRITLLNSRWNIEWRRGRLGRESGEEVVLWEVLSRVQIMEGIEDCWKWMHDAERRYAVKKAYEFLSPMEFILPDQILGGVMEFFLYELGGMVGSELGACLFLVGAWYIWYWRNIRVFQNKGECKDGLLHMIQSKTFLWIKNKVAGSVFLIFHWKFNPLECAVAIRKHRRLLRAFHKCKNGEHAE
ncbi:hypothetical protein SLEP1_g17212 [Rubroshorea leprosula]|uniref:Reverse transcriptase domain-containing protein n=1 Tax=Rubroshorea leprosula TaxID=152421 RepID=A0AAV5J2L4_9ROSI|nr:hypothetical protein SLEP1_g17212 [Rubroshorea leprosula]